MHESKQEHILFLTGKLAQKRLQRILEEMAPIEFTYEIRNIGVSVAALMTAQMLIRRLTELKGISQSPHGQARKRKGDRRKHAETTPQVITTHLGRL